MGSGNEMWDEVFEDYGGAAATGAAATQLMGPTGDTTGEASGDNNGRCQGRYLGDTYN